MPEEQLTYRQRLIEGLTVRFSLHRHSDGEEFELSIDSITEIDGDPQLRISVVDKYATVYEVDTIVGPSMLEVTEGEEIVVAEDDEENHHRLVSPKLAAIIGGATLAAGAAITVTYLAKRKK